MKLATSAVFWSLIAAAPLLATAPLSAQSAPDSPPPPPEAGMHPGGPHGPRGPMMFGPASHRVEPVTNSPFTAAFTEASRFTDREGKQVQRSSTSMVYRDSQGRVREEIMMQPPPPRPPAAAGSSAAAVPPSAPHSPRTMVTILDPVAHTITHLNAERQTAFVQTVPTDFFTHLQQREDRRESGQQPQHKRDGATSTDLGSRIFAGVSAVGKQTVISFPARDGGATHTITRQTWFSPDSKLEVSSSETSDRGTHSDTLTTFNKAEPNPSLFQVPAGYTTSSGPERHFRGPHHGGPGFNGPVPGVPDGAGMDGAPPPPPPSM